ncbi:MAG: hypothetical protein V7636_2041 [Actinomycetota bacterium]
MCEKGDDRVAECQHDEGDGHDVESGEAGGIGAVERAAVPDAVALSGPRLGGLGDVRENQRDGAGNYDKPQQVSASRDAANPAHSVRLAHAIRVRRSDDLAAIPHRAVCKVCYSGSIPLAASKRLRRVPEPVRRS